MHNPIPASHSYFFIPAFVKPKAAMFTTLRAISIGRNWVERVGQAAAVIANSATKEVNHA